MPSLSRLKYWVNCVGLQDTPKYQCADVLSLTVKIAHGRLETQRMLRERNRCFWTANFLRTSHWWFMWAHTRLFLRGCTPIEWTRSHFKNPKIFNVTSWHDTHSFIRSLDLCRRVISSTRKSVKVHACPGHWHWSKSFYSVGSFLWTVFILNDAFSEVRGFSVTLVKWNDPSEWKTFGDNICQNINLHSPAVCTISIWRWHHSVFYWTNAWCSVKLEGKPILTHAMHACTQKWYTDMRTITTWRSHRLHCEFSRFLFGAPLASC